MCGRTDIFCDIYSLYFTQKLNLVNDVKHGENGSKERLCFRHHKKKCEKILLHVFLHAN